MDWIAFALAFVGTLTLLMSIAWVAGAIRAQEVFDHDNTDVEDEEAIEVALEHTLAFHVVPYVFLDLNRPYHKDAA